MTASVRYRVGVDVGLRSVGFCAVEVDGAGRVVSILDASVRKHDGGVDPTGNKKALTRRFVSGVARRARSRTQFRAKQKREFETFLSSEFGEDAVVWADSYSGDAWGARFELVSRFIDDDVTCHGLFVVALRHIFRHRGWRNPYQRVESLFGSCDVPSEKFVALVGRVNERLADCGMVLSDGDRTLAHVVSVCNEFLPGVRLRGDDGLLGGTLDQSDYVREVRLACEMQKMEDGVFERVVREVFAMRSPKGSSAGFVGFDPLPGQGGLRRALRACPAFQKFRMVGVVANLRVAGEGGVRSLTRVERDAVVDFLTVAGVFGELPSWDDVALQIGVDRSDLRGVASLSFDGECVSRPPVDVTSRAVMNCGVRALVEWWDGAGDWERHAMVCALSNAGDEVECAEVDELLTSLCDEDLARLENVRFETGRAMYSQDSLERLTRFMEDECSDLYNARQALFHLPNDWTPPAPEITQPTGNIAVDRVLREVNRYLVNAQKKWGVPEVVNVENTRGGFSSVAVAREYERETANRRKANEADREAVRAELGISGAVSHGDVRRYRLLKRQKGECLYCGSAITLKSCEIDHIVPRVNGGSNNTNENLVAVCRSCNHSKSSQPFAIWAKTREGVSLKDAISRVRAMKTEKGTPKSFKTSMIARLKSTKPEEEFDGRSLESVAWMATELMRRTQHHYSKQGHKVRVGTYKGALTATARKVSRWDGENLHLIGGQGKNRLDIRHHAVDATIIALMQPNVSKVLSIRNDAQINATLTGRNSQMEHFTGHTTQERASWEKWCDNMDTVLAHLNTLLDENRVSVTQSSRRRLGSSEAHKAQIRAYPKTHTFCVQGAIPAHIIERANTPQLYSALTQQPDYTPTEGLPHNPHRTLSVKGKRLHPTDTLHFFPGQGGAINVRGGYADIGQGFHHARTYTYTHKGKQTVGILRVLDCDLRKHTSDNLFSVPLANNTLTMRMADKKLREAIISGEATHTGTLIVGQTLHLNLDKLPVTGAILTFKEKYPQASYDWQVVGMPSNTQLKLRPILLAGEGVSDDEDPEIAKIIKNGWIVSCRSIPLPLVRLGIRGFLAEKKGGQK